MKKVLILVLLLAVSYSVNTANAIETKASDYEIVKQVVNEPVESAEVVMEEGSVKVLKFNDKLGIYDNSKGRYIIQPVLDSVEPMNKEKTEFKIRAKKLVGFASSDLDLAFLTPYEDMFPYKDYLKVKKNGKYGLLDKKGNTLLTPIFQQVGTINSGDTEYLTGKIDGKYKTYYKTGKLVPENELYTISDEGFYAFAKDIRPIFKMQKYNNNLLYEKAVYNDTMTYEIKEIELPGKVKVQKDLEEKDKEVISDNIISVDNKDYIVVNNKKFVGLNNNKNKEIVPAKYDSIDFVRPCEHFRSQVILAKADEYYTIYDLKGHIIAEQLPDKINIYKYGRIYSYVFENGIWNLILGKKVLGTLVITGDEQYEFSKTAFHIKSLHKINELFLSILSAK